MVIHRHNVTNIWECVFQLSVSQGPKSHPISKLALFLQYIWTWAATSNSRQSHSGMWFVCMCLAVHAHTQLGEKKIQCNAKEDTTAHWLHVSMLKMKYANAWHGTASLSQHLNSVHRWTVLQLDLGRIQGQPSHITAECVGACVHIETWQRENDWEFAAMVTEQQYLIATVCWGACLFVGGWRGREQRDRDRWREVNTECCSHFAQCSHFD